VQHPYTWLQTVESVAGPSRQIVAEALVVHDFESAVQLISFWPKVRTVISDIDLWGKGRVTLRSEVHEDSSAIICGSCFSYPLDTMVVEARPKESESVRSSCAALIFASTTHSVPSSQEVETDRYQEKQKRMNVEQVQQPTLTTKGLRTGKR
jgi:hypothetical protein